MNAPYTTDLSAQAGLRFQSWEPGPKVGRRPKSEADVWASADGFGSPGCWLWNGTVGSHGYGVTGFMNRQWRAHRLTYELMVGPIPSGLVLDHLCRVTLCVNPAHLEPVTGTENTRRGARSHIINTGRCAKGHLMTAENTVSRRNGWVTCRTCRRAVQRVFAAKRRAAIKAATP